MFLNKIFNKNKRIPYIPALARYIGYGGDFTRYSIYNIKFWSENGEIVVETKFKCVRYANMQKVALDWDFINAPYPSTTK